MAGKVQELSYRVARHDDAVIVTIAGEIDMLTAPKVSVAIDEAFAVAPTVVVIDLSDVGFLASAGLAGLLDAQQRASWEHVDLRVVATDRHVCRSFQITGLNHALAMYDSVTSALTNERR